MKTRSGIIPQQTRTRLRVEPVDETFESGHPLS
jgi:hypothetical protein